MDSKRSFEDGGVGQSSHAYNHLLLSLATSCKPAPLIMRSTWNVFSAYLSSRCEARVLKPRNRRCLVAVLCRQRAWKGLLTRTHTLLAFSLLRWCYTGRFHTACKLPLQRKRVLAIELFFVNLEGEAQTAGVAAARVAAVAKRRTTELLKGAPTAPAEHEERAAAGSFGVILRGV